MDTVPRRRLPALVLHVVLAACLLPVLFKGDSIAASPRSSCTELREWAAPYRNSAPTLDELAAFDRRHRTAIWNAITPAARSALMGEHLHRWRQNDMSLSPLQRSLITEAAELLTPALYEPSTEAARKDWELFWIRAQVAFPAQHQQRQWFEIGPTPISSATDARSAEADACTCNFFHPIWTCEGTCVSGGCEYLMYGCGPGLMYPCDGYCVS